MVIGVGRIVPRQLMRDGERRLGADGIRRLPRWRLYAFHIAFAGANVQPFGEIENDVEGDLSLLACAGERCPQAFSSA
jgi:hypothetical protein